MRLAPILTGLLVLASAAGTVRAQAIDGAATGSGRHSWRCLVDCQPSPARNAAATGWQMPTGMTRPRAFTSPLGTSTATRLQISDLPSPPPGPPQAGTRYHCGSPAGYYPNVAVCRTAWKIEPSWPFK